MNVRTNDLVSFRQYLVDSETSFKPTEGDRFGAGLVEGMRIAHAGALQLFEVYFKHDMARAIMDNVE
jgi:hypothetical protein